MFTTHSEEVLVRIEQLQTAVKSVSTASSSRSLLRPSTLLAILEQAQLRKLSLDTSIQSHPKPKSAWERDLEWLLVSKATTQTYGLILNILLEQTIPLSNDIWYWDEVLGSNIYTGLFSVQTSPLRLWQWANDIYCDARSRLQFVGNVSANDAQRTRSLSDQWRRFYGLVKDSIRDRSLVDMRSKVMSPITLCRAEAARKQNHLKRLREMTASGLGVLMDEGLTLDVGDQGSIISKNCTDEMDKEEWKSVVAKSVVLLETVLRHVTALELGPSEFEDTVFLSVDEDPEIGQDHSTDEQVSSRLASLTGRLQQILQVHMPTHVALSKKLAAEYGRPSRLVRYWVLLLAVCVFSSTLLRVFVNRKAEILTWVHDLGETTMDFWYNWVIEPVKKIVGTIRHDKDSEVAIMSKGSLAGDRASLERMVVDFAMDNPSSSTGVALSEADIADIRAKVKEGDLTPVLKAYERDLRKPFRGTVRGDLARALLIQIQKTKVDVEVAISGIDALLKSQELVFGYAQEDYVLLTLVALIVYRFVGLTPGVLVCLGTFRWLSGFLSGREGRTEGKRQDQMVRILRFEIQCSDR